MSYVEAASQAGGEVGKVPPPVEVESTSDPSGSVQVEADKSNESALGGKAKIEQKVNDVKKDLPKLGEDFKKAKHDVASKVKKEYDAHKGDVKSFFQQVIEKISHATNYVFESTKTATASATEELKNPAVATQTVVTIGAVVGLVVGIQERTKIFRNKTDGEITAILAGLAGLIVLDGYLFTTNYKKYDKKSLK